MSDLKIVIGLMSGTSMDGIDAALLRSDGREKVEVLAHLSSAYSDDFRRQLKNSLEDATRIKNRHERPGGLMALEMELTLHHAQTVRRMLEKENLLSRSVDLIGFHGQTVLHRPGEGMTVQLGDGGMLARQTGIDVIYDLRANDMAHGGQGAPLVPAYHAAIATKLAGKVRFPLAFVNIGGIANLTYIPSPDMDRPDRLLAFDCGPGNCLIDQWMEERTGRSYDAGGQMGLKGKVHEETLETYRRHAFFRKSLPGTLDWRDFSPLCNDGLSVEDGAASLACLSAWAIFHSMRFLPLSPRSLIISGGGGKNGAVMSALADLADKADTMLVAGEQCGLDADFIEAEAWGYLAVRAAQRLPLSWPTTTGVQFPVTGGVFAPCSP